MGILRDLNQDAERLNRSLDKTQEKLNLPRLPGGGRGASAVDVRGLGLQIGALGRKLDSMGTRQRDPFLDGLTRGSGPRRVV